MIIKNASSSTSHKKLRLYVFPSLCLYVFMPLPLYFNPTIPLMLSPNYVSSCKPDSNKREGDVSLFCYWCRRKFFLRLSMISWGQFYVMEIFCNFLMSHFFDQITTLTYVLMDNFLSLFSYYLSTYDCLYMNSQKARVFLFHLI